MQYAGDDDAIVYCLFSPCSRGFHRVLWLFAFSSTKSIQHSKFQFDQYVGAALN